MSTLKYLNMAYALTLIAVLHGIAFCMAGCWPLFGDDSEPGQYDYVDSDSDTDTDMDIDTDWDTDCTQGSYTGDLEILDQYYLIALAGYTSISGNLRIEYPSCTDLSELICLTSVGGRLIISENDALTNLDGLSAITSIGGDLYISRNASLTNLNGLGALTSAYGIGINENPALTDLDGLNGLTSLVRSSP